MTQEEIWIRHIKNTKVDDILISYKEPAVFQKEFSAFINKLSVKDVKVIEVGCELGITSLLLNSNLDRTLLDLNPIAIQLTKQAHEKLNKEANFIVADMFDMPFENNYFDILFNAGVIEHFSKKERIEALIEYARVLKDDGVMLIAFPNHFALPYRIAYKIRRVLNRWPYPEEYKLFDLKEEIQESNLVLEERLTLSKSTLMNWLSFIPPLQFIFKSIDKFYPFEGYLTVLKIKKK